jgi:quinol-cytochrome oxidoreductase complex cytochrome b subunit
MSNSIYAWNVGALISSVMLIQLSTGGLLSSYYTSDVKVAYY